MTSRPMSNIYTLALRKAAERARADNHTQDEWFHYLRCSTPETMLALLDELEAKDKSWAAQDDHINQQADRIESLEKKNGELGRALGAAEERIAELEAREVLLPPKAPDNLASCLDGYEKWLIATTFRDTWNACLAEVVRVNAAAGKGE